VKKIEFDKLLQILGNLGVIAGILLLAYELNQNTASGRKRPFGSVIRMA